MLSSNKDRCVSSCAPGESKNMAGSRCVSCCESFQVLVNGQCVCDESKNFQVSSDRNACECSASFPFLSMDGSECILSCNELG